jgi:hypothetical protein
MASTYVNDLRLNEMATGDQSGSWGTVTNTNLELIAEAFSYSTEAITTNADAHTTTIADGATDPGRSMFLKYTGTLDSACTITIGPNTVSKLWFIENATSGSQNIIIKQGSGATVTIASGKTKAIYSDGVGSGAKMVDAFAALDVGSLSTGSLSTTGDITFGDNDKAIFGAGSDLQIYHDGSSSRIHDTGTGGLLINGSADIILGALTGEEYLRATENGAVSIKYDDATKLATTSGGVDITGNVTVSGTVDGRDVAADGVRLDTMETNADVTDTTNVVAALTAGTNIAIAANGTISSTNTTYSAGSGLDLSGTTFSLESDLRDNIQYIGRDSNDYMHIGSTVFDWFLDGARDMRLENDGDLHVDGNVIAYSTTTSDERLKKDIVKIDNALDKVSQLSGYTFEYKADGKKSAGVIAQEVEKVMPSAVSETTLPVKMGDDDTTEYKVVQYDQLHGLMIEAIKELKAEIEELKAR